MFMYLPNRHFSLAVAGFLGLQASLHLLQEAL